MAPTRTVVQDPNAAHGGAAPSQQLTVPGIQSVRRAPAEDASINALMSEFAATSQNIDRKQQNADFIEGQMASMAGKTQADIKATGNKTTMAGFVSLEVGNAVSEWAAAQQQAATSQHYGTDPAAYQKQLSASAAELISKMDGDDYAEEQLTRALAPTMQRLGAEQSTQNAAWIETETINSYTNSLVASGQYAAQGDETIGYTQPATSAGGDYRAFAAAMSHTLFGVESSHDVNAQNDDSTAGGVAQFIDGTWVSTIKAYRPDIAKGKTDDELLTLKKGPGSGALARAMGIQYLAEGARSLDRAGLTVTPGTAYLAYFAGHGGAKRVLRGDPSAPVSTTLTSGQIAANERVMYRNGRLISNAELTQWAERKMKGSLGASKQVQSAILHNPGLPPEKHRTAVVQAITTSLMAGDGSLYQNAGGIDGLAALNLSVGDKARIRTAHDSFLAERQNDYSMEYERARHNLLEQASSGEYSEEEMFTKLRETHEQFGRSDLEMQRLHTQMQDQIEDAGQTEALGVWAEPERQFDLIELKNDVLDGKVTAEDAMVAVQEIGKMFGADEVATEQAVQLIMGAYDRTRAVERADVGAAARAGQEQAKIRNTAAMLVSRNVLGTGTPQEQAAGVALLENQLMEDLMDGDIPPKALAASASSMMAKVLVQNDVIDKRRASFIRAAMADPLDANGEPTDEAVQSMAFYLDLKHGANAPPEYLTRMFAGNERTLEVLLTAEEHMVGDASMDNALAKAHAQVNNPITRARVAQANEMLKTGSLQNSVKEDILSNSGLTNTAWNRLLNALSPNWTGRALNEEQTARIMQDSGIDYVIESETRSAVGAYPNANESTISKIVSGQMAERGAVLGGSFVMPPPGKSMRSIMQLNSKSPDAANEALNRYVQTNGEELFGKAVWDDLTHYEAGVFEFDTPKEAEYVVELIGDNLLVTPAGKAYQFDDDVFFDDNASLPEAATVIIPARDVGSFFNKFQTKPKTGLLNTAVDLFGKAAPSNRAMELYEIDRNKRREEAEARRNSTRTDK